MTRQKTPAPVADPVPPEVANLSRVQVDLVQAELARIDHSLVNELHATEAELSRSGSVGVTGETVNAHQSWIGMVRGGTVTLERGGALALQAEQAALTDSPAGLVQAGTVQMSGDATAAVVAAREVKAERLRTVVLLAGKVEGPVETVLDTRRVLLASVVAGIAAGGMALLGQALFRRRK
ncbi:MAG: hypothetical protein FJZ96_09305 [Chloroflexi bacterium]|nr:hypothetical protein [Chloroflexota bacterium]